MAPRALVIALIASALSWAPAAHAVTIGFGCITNNNAIDCGIGEAQLTVDVTDPGGNQVLFTFSNSGPADSAITDVYFDDGSLLGIASILDNPPDVDFMVPAIPAELPGANNVVPPFVTTQQFSAGADPPPATTGVDPGESVGVVFDLINAGTYADVLAELDSGALRIGIKVQDFASTGSESFVNLPEPATGGLLALGLLFTTFGVRRRS